jgi:hypothetical protein
MLQAVRADKHVGTNTCSVIEECYTDEEILEVLIEKKVRSKRKAVTTMRKIHWLHLDVCEEPWY